MSAFKLGIVHAPEPQESTVAKPSKRALHKQQMRQRHLEKRGDDPDGDILPMVFPPGGKARYRKKLLERDPHCIFCGKTVSDDATLDHAKPYSHGGPDAPWNLFLCCRRCNEFKNNTHPLVLLERFRNACERMGLLSESEDDSIDWSGIACTTG